METTFAEVFPVGELLSDELQERGWTQTEFAEILGRPTQFVSEIVAGKKEITRESAAQIGAALGTSAEFWLNLQDAFFLWKQRQNPQTAGALTEVRTRALMNELAPMSVLRKRGVITAVSTAEQADQLKVLMQIASLEDRPSWSLAARRSNQDEPLSASQNAWFACVRQIADQVGEMSNYSAEALMNLAPNLSRLVREPEAFRSLPEVFANCGVRLVFFEALPSSKISGASYLDGRGPVIALSGRGQRLDKVLFTLLHEIAHLVRGDVAEDKLVIDEDDHTLGDEDKADELASTWVFDEVPLVPDRVNADWIQQEANARGIHPIVLVGRLQKEGRIPWRSALVKDAPSATPFLRTWQTA